MNKPSFKPFNTRHILTYILGGGGTFGPQALLLASTHAKLPPTSWALLTHFLCEIMKCECIYSKSLFVFFYYS